MFSLNVLLVIVTFVAYILPLLAKIFPFLFDTVYPLVFSTERLVFCIGLFILKQMVLSALVLLWTLLL
jgi:hypothetical protein